MTASTNGTIRASANGPGVPTMSVPSLGLIAAISERKSTIPTGMPTTIATSPSAAPPELTTASTPRGVRPIALRMPKSRARSRVTSSSVVSRFTSPTATSSALEPKTIGRMSARSWRTSSLTSSVATAWPARRSMSRVIAAPSVPGAKPAITSPSPIRSRGGQRGAAEDHDLAVVVGLHVAADELDA